MSVLVNDSVDARTCRHVAKTRKLSGVGCYRKRGTLTSTGRPMRIFLLLLAISPLCALAQDPQPEAWTPPYDIDVYDLPTASNGVGYRLFVRQPLVAPREGERPITVYVLDALWDLPAVSALHSNIEFLRRMPPILFVGVGYQNETNERLEANRTRDYTPTEFQPEDPDAHFLKPVDYENIDYFHWHEAAAEESVDENTAAPDEE